MEARETKESGGLLSQTTDDKNASIQRKQVDYKGCGVTAPKKGGAGIQQLSSGLIVLSIGLTILQWVFLVAYYTPDG